MDLYSDGYVGLNVLETLWSGIWYKCVAGYCKSVGNMGTGFVCGGENMADHKK